MTNPSEPQLRTSTLSPRLGFAALLWLGALIPPGIYAVQLASPVETVELANRVGAVMARALQIGVLALVVAALLYPPFLPWVRLGFRRIRNRMSVDQGSMYRALEELRHLETAANHLVVARTMRNMGGLRGALAHAMRAVQMEPDGVAARFLLGSLLREAGQTQAAVEHLQAVVNKEPDHAFGEARVQLGIAQLQAGKDAEGLSVLEQHRAEFGGSRKTLYLIARARRTLGQSKEAREALLEAVSPGRDDERLTPEEELYRARARVGLWRTGGRR